MTRRSVFIVIPACAVMVLAWYFLLWGPSTKSYETTKTKLDTLTAQKNSLTSRVASLKRADVAKLEGQVGILSSAVPPTPELDQFFHQIQDAATSAGIVLSAVAPAEPSAPSIKDAKGAKGAPPAATGVTEIRVAVTTNGSYEQTVKFIDALDASQRLVIIDGINVAVDPANGGLNTQLTMRIFTTQKVAAKATGAVVPSGTGAEAK